MITYNVENVKMPAIKRRETTAWIRRVADTYGKKVGEVGYLFCDDEHILEVNLPLIFLDLKIIRLDDVPSLVQIVLIYCKKS